MKRLGLIAPLAVAWVLLAGVAVADPKPISSDAKEYIIWPADGQVIQGANSGSAWGSAVPA